MRFQPRCHGDGQLLFCGVIDGACQAGIDFRTNPLQQEPSELRVSLRNQSAVVWQLDRSRDDKWNAQATGISRSGLGLLVYRQSIQFGNVDWVLLLKALRKPN